MNKVMNLRVPYNSEELRSGYTIGGLYSIALLQTVSQLFS